jgi:hypothetical protein
MVRMLDGHFGMFDASVNNYTSNAIHSGIIAAVNPMNKKELYHVIDVTNNHYVVEKLPIPKPGDPYMAISDSFFQAFAEPHDDYHIIFRHRPKELQGSTDIHLDMMTMLALQAERWGITKETAKDTKFQTNLKDSMVRWAETVYASRALKMLQALDDGRLSVTPNQPKTFILSKDDAKWLQGYIKKRENSELALEKTTAEGLNAFAEKISAAATADKDNTDSVLNRGYILSDNGESLERNASISWLAQAREKLDNVKQAMGNWKNGRTSSKQASDALITRASKLKGFTL